jgi:hypothetical protein
VESFEGLTFSVVHAFVNLSHWRGGIRQIPVGLLALRSTVPMTAEGLVTVYRRPLQRCADKIGDDSTSQIGVGGEMPECSYIPFLEPLHCSAVTLF